MNRSPIARRDAQRGAAALIVVIVLFFILALVTAYAGRSLIFEQRTSINNQRAAQAFEAAESGLEFAIGLLSGGRVDAQCVSSNDGGNSTFRQRYLQNDGGVFTIPPALADLRPTCMLLGAGTTCSCPTAGPPALAPPVGGLAPTFQVRFDTTGIAQAGVVRATATGCSNIGTQCFAASANSADAVAEVSVLLGLNSALATPPAAALTVRNTLNLNNRAVTIVNADVPSRGITIDAGGPLVNDGSVRLSSVPGTPGSASALANDTSLADLGNGDRMFVSVFGMDRNTYRAQPAAVPVTCSADCGVDIGIAVAKNPGRVIWVQGPATISSAQVLGTEAQPVMLVVQGDLTASANLQLFGVLYLHGGGGANTWTTAVGSTLVQGAVVAEGDLSVDGTPTIVFNPAVLRTINLTQGSLVRIPGSWRDFAAGS
ncbi:MAG TPA: PilX N-terminal domain-containing pilus assembly protein [Burkholderiaceae bacterium]|nr:PilX N-terminal domain-containing pilus assembly protein [Burkholderiaceae bacterium]